MKRMIKSILTIIFMVVFTIIISSCSKQDNLGQTDKLKPEKAINGDDAKTLSKIVEFKDKIAFYQLHPIEKSSETTTVDSAVWYLDATLNLLNKASCGRGTRPNMKPCCTKAHPALPPGIILFYGDSII